MMRVPLFWDTAVSFFIWFWFWFWLLEHCLGFARALLELFLFFFCDLAFPPFEPAETRRSCLSCAFVCSSSKRGLKNLPDFLTKNSAKTTRTISCSSPVRALSFRNNHTSSAGTLHPGVRQQRRSRRLYAPSSANVRWAVSASKSSGYMGK